MPLQFILGSSGSGKSRYLYETVIRESLAAPKEKFSGTSTGAVYDGDSAESDRASSAERNLKY